VLERGFEALLSGFPGSEFGPGKTRFSEKSRGRRMDSGPSRFFRSGVKTRKSRSESSKSAEKWCAGIGESVSLNH
jgi:hypothetical protein